MSLDLEGVEAQRRRLRRALFRPGARVVEQAGRYVVRTGADGRRRAACTVDLEAFTALAREGALAPAGEGAWRLARTAAPEDDACGARPGLWLGEREIVDADGTMVKRRANLGESPLDWLARRRTADGRPLLTPAEHAAGERLRADFHAAGVTSGLTIDWSAPPRGFTPRGPDSAPGERARFARDRLLRALDAAGPGLREIVERVCLAESSLEAAERALGHPRRSGKTLLKLGLQRVAAVYGIT